MVAADLGRSGQCVGLGESVGKELQMTADQLISQLFVNHWVITTIVAPEIAFLYAWVTDQTAWMLTTLVLLIVGYSLKK